MSEYPQQYAPPAKKPRTVRNIAIAIAIMIVLLVAGCMTLLGSAVNEADKSIKRGQSEVGGTNNPLEIHPGQQFSVRGFEYKAGWKLRSDALGDMDVTGLRVTNGRKDRDSALVEIKIWKGDEVVALADCSTEPILPKTTTKLSCSSTDKVPRKYTRVTISDSF